MATPTKTTGGILRVGSYAGIAGALLGLVGNLLHPATPIGDPEGVARTIALAPREFRVQVREGDRETIHQVTVPERLGEGLQLHDDDLERVVRESFRFLLERERATSILARFSLSDISRYFPEYPSELAHRLS
jgi:hypothetical protein